MFRERTAVDGGMTTARIVESEDHPHGGSNSRRRSAQGTLERPSMTAERPPLPTAYRSGNGPPFPPVTDQEGAPATQKGLKAVLLGASAIPDENPAPGRLSSTQWRPRKRQADQECCRAGCRAPEGIGSADATRTGIHHSRQGAPLIRIWPGQPAGVMFGFIRNRFVGSYFALSRASRS